VQRLFGSINEMVEDDDCFVVVLIGALVIHYFISLSSFYHDHVDEVESLTAARAGAMAGTEPSDGLRVRSAILSVLPGTLT
jgi:hypothetical protein